MSAPNMDREEQMAFARMLDDIEDAGRRIAIREAKANPREHKLTRVFDRPATFRFWDTVPRLDGFQTVAFCWSCHRNAAGYFLAWREIATPSTGKVVRDQWKAGKVKARLRERAARLTAEALESAGLPVPNHLAQSAERSTR